MTEKDYLLVLEDIARTARDFRIDSKFLAFIRQNMNKCLDDLDRYRMEKARKKEARKAKKS